MIIELIVFLFYAYTIGALLATVIAIFIVQRAQDFSESGFIFIVVAFFLSWVFFVFAIKAYIDERRCKFYDR